MNELAELENELFQAQSINVTLLFILEWSVPFALPDKMRYLLT